MWKWILIIHLLISFATAYIGKKGVNPQEKFCLFLIALLCPISGLILILALKLTKSKSSQDDQDEDTEDLSRIILFTEKTDKSKEINVMSLEDVLMSDNVHIKRTQMIETLKRDATGYMDKLQMALSDDDIETSHYAASALSVIKRDFELKHQELEVMYNQNKEDYDIGHIYQLFLKEYVESKILDKFSKLQMQYKLIHVSERQIEYEDTTTVDYDVLIQTYFDVDELENAKNTAELYIEKFNNEKSHIFMLKSYYLEHNIESFRIAFNNFTNSPVTFSRDGLEIVRFWAKGLKDEN